MKKLFVLFALVFVAMAAQAQAPSQEFVDGVILRTSFVDGDEVAYIDVNGDMIWDQRVNIRRIADAYNFDCHAFRRGRTISEAICLGLWQLQRELILSRGENPANYGYGYYGSGAAMYSALRTASGGIYLNMGGFRLNLGLFRGLDGITRVSVGGGTRHIGGGVTVPIQKKNKVQSQPAQQVQVQVQPQPQAKATTETVEINGKTYNVVKKSPAELREMMRRK